jgi:hypothetical protein
MQSINWDAHGMAICHHFHQRVHLTKLIHDILPTNDNVSLWKSYALKNVPLAHTPEKTAIMFFAAPTCLKWNGDEPFLSISEQHVTNCILILTFKKSYSQLWKPGLPTAQPIFLSILLSIPTSFNNKRRSAGVSYSMESNCRSLFFPIFFSNFGKSLENKYLLKKLEKRAGSAMEPHPLYVFAHASTIH